MKWEHLLARHTYFESQRRAFQLAIDHLAKIADGIGGVSAEEFGIEDPRALMDVIDILEALKETKDEKKLAKILARKGKVAPTRPRKRLSTK